MRKHAAGSGDLDEGLRRLREALMIAGETTPAGHPGDAAFHNPPLGKNLEDPLRWLCLCLGLG